MKFGRGANNGPKTTQNEFEMPTTIFRPTGPTNQNRPLAKIINCVFRPIWKKFGMEANMGLQRACKEFERSTTIFYLPAQPTRTD